MLPRMKINTRRKSLGYYTDEIEAPNACPRRKFAQKLKTGQTVDIISLNSNAKDHEK
ncbi:MAG: hypothetical protein WBC22_02910 [Sedimentisphaerales bacterium]